MTQLDVRPIRAFQDNYIWLIRSPGDPGVATVVDPGDAAPVLQALADGALRLGAILITLVVFALLFCLFLYFKGRYLPTSEDRSVSGNFVWAY